jgi:ornithine cyclodeaminase/alanine dehydrogenase-like protein (mu-crystallin family)
MDLNRILYLAARDVERAGVDMKTIIDALDAAYRLKGQGEVEMPSKIGIHTRPNALIHAMPAYIRPTGTAGMKWIGAYPENFRFHVPQISGLIVLNDEQTGLPYCIMDCRWITAKRTGAKTAVAAGFFARKNAASVGILGCGVQGRSNLEALCERFTIRRVLAFDIDQDAARRYAAEMSARCGVEVTVADTPADAVRRMDIVVTAGPIIKEPSPVIENEWFEPGAFAAPVDFDSYWKPQAMKNADLFVTDDVKQMFYYQSIGYFRHIPARERVHDLGDVAIEKAPRRSNESQRIIAMNLGLAMDDMAVAPLVYQAAKDKGLGTWLDL